MPVASSAGSLIWQSEMTDAPLTACPWPVEEIPNGNWLYRQVPSMSKYFDEVDGKRFPNEANFHCDETGLSLHWERYADVKWIYLFLSLCKNAKGNYRDYRSFQIFRLPAGVIRSTEGVESVVHSPLYWGNPAPDGTPNNRAHASAFYPDDVEIRLKLRDWVGNNLA